MKRILFVIAAAVMMLTAAEAAPKKKELVKPSMIVKLYPKGQDVDEGIAENGTAITMGPLESNGLSGPERDPGNNRDTYNISDPQMELYFPKKPNGQMVVVCPGGGYFMVSMWNEGDCVADWLVQQGITVCVVKYRLPNGHWQIPLHDVQNAFRYCRAHAAEWGVKQIGIMGFSAGGHLAATASNFFADDATKPDFSVLIYPVISLDYAITHKGTHNNLIGSDERWLDKNLSGNEYEKNKAQYDSLLVRYSLHNQVTAAHPSTFIALSSNDTTVPVVNSLMYYQELVKNKVSAEMHIYPKGGHGWGFRRAPYGVDRLEEYRQTFFDELDHWLDLQLKKAE